MVSAQGQRAVVRQMFEVAPTNKILWSSKHLAYTLLTY